MSVAKKCATLARPIAQRSEESLETLDGNATLGEAIVREAVAVPGEDSQLEPRGKIREGAGAGWIFPDLEPRREVSGHFATPRFRVESGRPGFYLRAR